MESFVISTDWRFMSIPYMLSLMTLLTSASARPGSRVGRPAPPACPLSACTSSCTSSSVLAASMRNAPEPHAGSSILIERSLLSSAGRSPAYSAARSPGVLAAPDLERYGIMVFLQMYLVTYSGV